MRNKRGFTLIELMVVMAITALMVGGGLAAYTNFNQREILKSAGVQLYNALRFAQGKAAANEKPASCESSMLEGYQLRFTSDTSYAVEVVCSGLEMDIGMNANLPTGVIRTTGAGVFFYILGKGAERESFCLNGFGRLYSIEVSGSGEIVDNGLVGSCP